MIVLAERVVVLILAVAAYTTAGRTAPALRLALWNGARAPQATFGAETWLAPGAAHPAAGWLGDALLARLAPLVGGSGLALLAGIVWAAALLITERRARDRGGAIVSACAVVLAFATGASGSLVGDRGATNAVFAALLLLALDRTARSPLAATSSRAAVAYPVTVVFLWAWLTPDALLGVAFATAAAIGVTVEARLRGEAFGAPAGLRDAWVVAAGCLAATLATPATFGYLGASLAALRLDGAKQPFSVAPGDVAPLAYHSGFMALLVLAILVGGRYGPRPLAGDAVRTTGAGSPPADAAVLAVAIAIGFFDGASLPVAGIAAAPVLAGAAVRRFGGLGSAGDAGVVRRLAPLGIIAFGLAALTGAIALDRRAGPTPYDATMLVDRIAADPHARALFCGQPLWCDAALGSHVRVGLDGRTGWPPAAVDAQTTVVGLGPRWEAVLARGGVDRIVALRATGLAGILRLRSDWREIGSDGVAAAFERTNRQPGR